MRKSIIFMLMVTLTVVTGCDFFRKLAGRPTSEDIENKRVAIMRAEEAARQAQKEKERSADVAAALVKAVLAVKANPNH